MDENLQQLLKKAAAALKAIGAKEVYVFGSAALGEDGYNWTCKHRDFHS